MDPLVFLAILLIISVVCVVVSAPFRGAHEHVDQGARAAGADAAGEPVSDEREELGAEREAKYREIRDAELDHRTGKLSDEDFEALERSLRAEAVEILRRLDALDGS